MGLGKLVQDIVHAITVGAWIGLLASIVILFIRNLYSMPWRHFREPIQRTPLDAALAVFSVICLIILGHIHL